MSSAQRPSWACAVVDFKVIVRPMASVTAWILEVRPPRERPEAGADPEAITAAAGRTIGQTRSMGLALGTCHLPGSPKDDRIPAGMAELGLGVRGEQVVVASASHAMTLVADRLSDAMSDTAHVALLNNLGGVSELEMSVLAREPLTSSIGSRNERLGDRPR